MTPADFKIRYPQFANVDDARVQFFIDDSVPYFDVPRWGAFFTRGVAAWVAHVVVLDQFQSAQTGAAAALNVGQSSKRVGDVAVSQDPGILNLQAKDPFMRTIYGQEYVRLRRIVGSGGLAV